MRPSGLQDSSGVKEMPGAVDTTVLTPRRTTMLRHRTFTVPHARDLHAVAAQHLHAWLREDGLAADRLGDGAPRLGDGVHGSSLAHPGSDEGRTVLTRVVEERDGAGAPPSRPSTHLAPGSRRRATGCGWTSAPPTLSQPSGRHLWSARCSTPWTPATAGCG